MKRGIILLLAIVALTAAMVPKERRAVNTEEEEARSNEHVETTAAPEIIICAPQTPCAWSIYKPPFKIIDMNITNTYCECSKNTTCQLIEDDSSVYAYVHRCRQPPKVKPVSES